MMLYSEYFLTQISVNLSFPPGSDHPLLGHVSAGLSWKKKLLLASRGDKAKLRLHMK